LVKMPQAGPPGELGNGWLLRQKPIV